MSSGDGTDPAAAPVIVRTPQSVLPPTVLVQHEVRDVFAAQPGMSRLGQRLVSTAFDSAGVTTRRTVLDELQGDTDSDDSPFYDAASGRLIAAGTKQRNDRYIEQAGPLAVEVAGRALAAAPSIAPADVTHVITVSCTGFFAPGLDFVVARALGLPPSVQRYHLGFMGCYAALPALRAAAQFCRADPDAVVLVVSVELCTLHLRSSNDPDTIVATSLFGDGAAAALVSRRPLVAGERGLRVERFESRTTPTGVDAMAWTIGDEGFEMVLSATVPQVIGRYAVDALRPLLDDDPELTDALEPTALESGALADAVQHWAVHPGGRSIVDRVEAAFALRPQQVAPSRAVLAEVGNLSSATVLLVLERILRASVPAGDRVIAMAFGPGLTVESARFGVMAG